MGRTSTSKLNIDTSQSISSIFKLKKAVLDFADVNTQLLNTNKKVSGLNKEQFKDLDKLIHQHKRLAREQAEATRVTEEQIAANKKLSGLSKEQFQDLERLIRQHKRLAQEQDDATRSAQAQERADAKTAQARAKDLRELIVLTAQLNAASAHVDTIRAAGKIGFLPSAGRAARSRSPDDVFRENIRIAQGFDNTRKAAEKKNKSLKSQNDLHDDGTAAAGRQRRGIGDLARDWGLFTRVLFVAQVHRAINLLSNSIRDAVREAHQLSIRIAEIQTIQGRASTSSTQWSTDLRTLSNSFGIPILEAAEGAYQAISNQVVSAANSVSFLREETKLAKTTVATLDTAVSATSSVLNAFNLNLSETHSINAKLFKAVEIGRFRLNELGSQFGRTSILASQLGVSLDEELGALTLMTRKGLQADVALTLLTNVFNSLLKPSKELSIWLSSIGFSSGQAAIRALGFTNVMGKLAAEADKSADGLSDIATKFQDLRALTGAGALTGFFGELTDDIAKLKTSTADFDKAITTTFSSLGQRATVQLTELRNAITFQFGQPLLQTFVNLSESIGGLTGGFNVFIRSVRNLITTYVVYRTVVVTTNVAQALFNSNLIQSIIRADSWRNSLIQARVAINGIQVATAAWTLGLSLVATALIDNYLRVQNYGTALDLVAQKTRKLVEETSERRLKGNIDALNKSFNEFNETVKSDSSAIDIFIANTRVGLNKISSSYEDAFKKLASSIKKTFDEIESTITKSIHSDLREAEKLSEAADRARGRVTDINDKEAGRRIDALLDGEDSLAKFETLEREKLAVHRQAVAARTRDDEKSATHLFELEEKLSHKQAEILRKLREDALKEKEKDETSRVTFRTDAFGRPRLNRQGQPTFRRVRTSRTVAAPDEVAAFEHLTRLNELETERKKLVAERISLETAAAARADAAATKAEAAAKKKEKDFERLKALLSSLEEGKTPDQFKKGRIEAEALIGGSGLSASEQLNLIAKLKEKEVLLFRQAEIEKTKAQIDEIEKRKDLIVKAITDAADKEKAARAAAQSSAEGTVNDTDVLIGKLKQFDKDFNIKRVTSIGGGAKVEDDTVEQEFKLFIQGLEIASNKVKALQAAGKDTTAALKELKAAQSGFQIFAAGVGGRTDLRLQQSGIRGATGFRQPFKDARGSAFSLAPGGEALSLELKALKEKTDAAIAADKAIAESKAKLLALDRQRKELNDEAAKVPATEVAAAKASEDWAKRSTAATDAIAKGMDGVVKKLQEIRVQINTMPPLPAPTGKPPGKAFGGGIPGYGFGRGIDSQLALLDPSEIVMTGSASRAFGPFLHALNNSNSSTKGNSGSVSFGNINITAPEGTTSVQARDLVAQLQRLTRRGLY